MGIVVAAQREAMITRGGDLYVRQKIAGKKRKLEEVANVSKDAVLQNPHKSLVLSAQFSWHKTMAHATLTPHGSRANVLSNDAVLQNLHGLMPSAASSSSGRLEPVATASGLERASGSAEVQDYCGKIHESQICRPAVRGNAFGCVCR